MGVGRKYTGLLPIPRIGGDVPYVGNNNEELDHEHDLPEQHAQRRSLAAP